MPISQNLVDHLANLARLELTEDEKKRYLKDLSSILGYVEKIQKLAVKSGGTLINERTVNIWREDEMAVCPDAEKQAIIESFPEKEGDLLKVKGVFE